MTATAEKTAWRLPAEWEPQQGVIMTWPDEHTDWAPMLSEVCATYRQMASAIAASGVVLYVVSSRPLSAADVGTADFCNIVCPLNDTWVRDYGPLTLTRCDGLAPGTTVGDVPSARLLHYRFNGWGGKFEAQLDNAVARHFYEQAAAVSATAAYAGCQDFVLEGGSIDTDGRGTLLTTTRCLLAATRNPGLSRADIEARLCGDLGVSRVLWLDHGHVSGDDTDGHVDTLARFAPSDTILYVACDDPQDEQYADLAAMAAQLRTLRTADGRPYRLVGLPTPAPLYDEADGTRLPATYANFLVLPGRVLLPTYGQPSADAEAARLVAAAFPGRRVVGIDSRSLIRQHGSIHCSTMQLPLPRV